MALSFAVAFAFVCLVGARPLGAHVRTFAAAGGGEGAAPSGSAQGPSWPRREVAAALGLGTLGLPPSSFAEELAPSPVAVAPSPVAVAPSPVAVAPSPVAVATGPVYDDVTLFNSKPKVFVAGSTGELGRRVVYFLLKNGWSVRAGIRDLGRAAEVQYENRRSGRYELQVVQDALIEPGRQKQLEEAIGDASVVINVAGARLGFDILRIGVGLDQTEAGRTDLNGTKALIDAAKARGVKKFVQVSAILTNARALKEDERSEFTNWNWYGNVLDCKHDAELYLQKSGLDYTLIRPAPMVNDLPEQVGAMLFEKPDSILLKPGEPGNRISRDDVANACIDAVFNPKAQRGVFELVAAPRQPALPKEKWWDVAA